MFGALPPGSTGKGSKPGVESCVSIIIIKDLASLRCASAAFENKKTKKKRAEQMKKPKNTHSVSLSEAFISK